MKISGSGGLQDPAAILGPDARRRDNPQALTRLLDQNPQALKTIHCTRLGTGREHSLHPETRQHFKSLFLIAHVIKRPMKGDLERTRQLHQAGGALPIYAPVSGQAPQSHPLGPILPRVSHIHFKGL